MAGGKIIKQKNKISETIDVLEEEQECTDFVIFVIIDGELYPENQILPELKNEKDLPEVIDEDMLYEEYRDRELFDTETGHPKN